MKPYFTINKISRSAVAVVVALVISVIGFAQGGGNGQGNSGNGNGNGGPNELSFRNATLAAGTAGADGAVYRFSSVAGGIDALVKINGRSSSLVKLVSIDLTNTGWDKAFQPQVIYNNGNTPAGNTDWWMEFSISFVQSNTTSPLTVSAFDVTALDIDGDGNKLQEYVSLYNQDKYTTEKNTALTVTDILESILSVLGLDGKKFVGPVKQYSGIDTSATDVMTTNSYKNTNSFRVRAGGQASGVTSGEGRMYSFWFKSFNFQAPVQNSLPVTLTSFEAQLGDNKVNLAWEDASEFRFSHFIVERSTDGFEYSDAAMIFSNGVQHGVSDYAFTDKINTNVKGILYYRLKMVDQDGAYVYSKVRIVRTGAEDKNMTVVAYPNPVVNDLRVTVPQGWQTKQVVMDLYNMNGQVVKHFSTGNASQTEVLNVVDMPAGMYVLKASNGTEVASQKILKSK